MTNAATSSSSNVLDVAVIEANARLALWADLLNERIKPQTMLEIGVWRGAYTAQILGAVPSIATYWMIDPWRRLACWNKPLNTADLENAFGQAMQATAFAGDKVKVLRGTTIEMIDQIPDGSLDFAYIDGDHTLRGITADLVCVYPKLRPDGYIGGDDFEPSPWAHGPRFEPTLVFPFALYFAEAVGAELWALGHNQFLMRKPSHARGFHFHDADRRYGQSALSPLMAPPRKSLVHRAVDKLRRLVKSPR